MDLSVLSNIELGDQFVAVLFALGAFIAVFAVAYGLIAPPKGRPRQTGRVKVEGGPVKRIAAWLDEQQMGVSAADYIRRSLQLGIPLGIGLMLLVGSVFLAFAGFIAGFILTGTRMEQVRDRRQVTYTKQLASACDTIRTAYGVNPSLKRALEAVAQYGQSPVREDFQEILVAASQERFAEGLQEVAERRRSIVFDTVATALLRASEASGEVNDMLVRLASSTRANVDAYEEALSSQINARSSIEWGSFGPWMIFSVFRVLTLVLSFAAAQQSFVMNTTFFSTPAGNIVALLAASITLYMYRYAMSVSRRGLLVRRIAVTETRIQLGQKPLPTQSAMSAQAQPATSN